MTIAKELEYKSEELLHGSYQLSKIIPPTGTTSTITSSGGNEILFELPARVFNLSKSILNFTLLTPASGANQYN
jgi:hypothetical protein